MVVLLTKVVSVLCGVLTCTSVLNAFATRAWQFWVAALAFLAWTIGWWALGAHWTTVGSSSRVVLDTHTGLIAATMVVVFIVASLCLSTLG
ncbi:hypothetical protein HMPREF1531_02417 [Propionibacterium sp. oral taxon 192 str. F0372]|uniref:hypothetical protein n=1 Tax=Propionibacterium sp. oral taxon 192 TaxID=671222 RepID=UPI000352870F|nr:hypothetical protein [Propionibacterium sp. oral taxon 192]EPH00309.1 hypothetical protein HMPREF1531_02417 [Propionibacterium sp. oral taxon 192 str. F0372]